MSILMAREEMRLKGNIESDVAALSSLLLPLTEKYGRAIRFMRDPTRGGVGVTLNEIAEQVNGRIVLRESDLPVRREVKGACELLGFDPIYLANEGKAVMVVDGGRANEILHDIRAHPLGKHGEIIGKVNGSDRGPLLLQTSVGGIRVVDYPTGEQLPRIC